MRRRIILAAVLLAVGGHLAGDIKREEQRAVPIAEAHHYESRPAFRPGCDVKPVPVKRYVDFTRTRYRRAEAPLRRSTKRWVRHLRYCLASREKRARARRWTRAWRHGLRFRLAEARLAPYVCHWSATSGRSVIPCYIVECESHGLWTAYNPSGAEGRYQLLGHGQPWPVITGDVNLTRRRILEHHRIARSLPLSSAWEQCD